MHISYKSSVMFAAVACTAALGASVLSQFTAQSTGSGGTANSSSSSSVSSMSSSSSSVAADLPPVVNLSIQSATTGLSGYRPGARAYYTVSITDDKAIKQVTISTSQMMYSTSPITMWQCANQTFCEEKVYIIVPSNPGAQFVTVSALDNANQVTTKTVTFDAPACVSDADCGASAGSIQWAGATFCGSEVIGAAFTDIMQYGVIPVCKSGGICDTNSRSMVKERCGSGQMCTTQNTAVCIATPPPCTPSAAITATCVCGSFAITYPSHWDRYCCYNATNIFTSSGVCPASPGTTPGISSSSQSSITSSWASSSHGTGSSTLLPTGGAPSVPSGGSSGGGWTPSWTSAPSMTASGAIRNASGALRPLVPVLLPAAPAPQSTPTASGAIRPLPISPPPVTLQPLRESHARVLQYQRKLMLRELSVFERYFRRTREGSLLTQVRELMQKIIGFQPSDATAFDTVADFQDTLDILDARRTGKKPSGSGSLRRSLSASGSIRGSPDSGSGALRNALSAASGALRTAPAASTGGGESHAATSESSSSSSSAASVSRVIPVSYPVTEEQLTLIRSRFEAYRNLPENSKLSTDRAVMKHISLLRDTSVSLAGVQEFFNKMRKQENMPEVYIAKQTKDLKLQLSDEQFGALGEALGEW